MLDVFDSKATPNDGLELLLFALSEAGYELGIITSGEPSLCKSCSAHAQGDAVEGTTSVISESVVISA